MPSIESYQLLLAAAAACEDKKAEDIRILALSPEESGLSDYFLICNGTNDRQNGAISDEIELRLKREFNTYPNAVEGRRQGEWILMDYVDFIVHIFSPEKRAFYGLERLRKSAITVSTDQLTSELTTAMEAQLSPSRKRGKRAAEPEEAIADKAEAKPAKTAKKGSKAEAEAAKPAKKVASKASAKTASKAAGSGTKAAVTKPVAKKAVAKKAATTKKAAAKKTASKPAAKKAGKAGS